MIYQHHYTNNLLGFSRGRHLRPIDKVVLSLFRTGTPFSSTFLRVILLEPKGTLPF